MNAKPSTRFLSYLIDSIIVIILCNLFFNIKIFNPYYEENIEINNKYNTIFNDYVNGNISEEEYNDMYLEILPNMYKYSISNYIIVIIILFSYFVLFQKYNNGQTIGSKLLNIKIDATNNKLSFNSYIIKLLFTYIFTVGGTISILLIPLLLIINNNLIFYKIVASISIINLLIILIDILFMIVRKDKLMLRDILSNTKVIKIEK